MNICLKIAVLFLLSSCGKNDADTKESRGTTWDPDKQDRALNLIDGSETLLSLASTLSSDEMEGRKPGEIGFEKASEVVEKFFESIGISYNENLSIRYRQSFEFGQNATRTHNLISVIEGEFPERGAIVIGAHLDHMGVNSGIIMHGAIDNASGSSVVLDIARMVARQAIKPKRTTYFVLFSAEESGLIGSRFFIEKMQSESIEISYMLNIDSVGLKESPLIHFGSSTHSNPEEIFLLIDEGISGVSRRTDQISWGSDHACFHHILGIPVGFLLSQNAGLFIHTTKDTIENLSEASLSLASKYGLNILKAIDIQINLNSQFEQIPNGFKKFCTAS